MVFLLRRSVTIIDLSDVPCVALCWSTIIPKTGAVDIMILQLTDAFSDILGMRARVGMAFSGLSSFLYLLPI